MIVCAVILVVGVSTGAQNRMAFGLSRGLSAELGKYPPPPII